MKETSKQRKNTTNKEEAVIACLLSFFLLMLSTLVFATPTGPSSIVVENNSTKQVTNGMMVNISGGYIAKLNISASVQNPHWKAFVGDVSGSFTLDDATGSTIYNWSAGASTGEVYATRESGSITWTSISCANAAQVQAEENALHHFSNTDNLTSTFTPASNTETYVVGTNPAITASQCFALNTFVNNDSQTASFEEVILSDTTNIILTTLIEEGGKTGYDGGDYDFQMLIPENASSGSAQIPYYIYVELG